MALIGNRSVLLKSPGRFLSGTVASIERNNWRPLRNRFEAMDRLSGIPSGHLSPSAWVLPQFGGGMSSRNASIGISATGNGALGRGISGSAAVAINAMATGQLIAGAVGTATIGLSGSASITAILSAVGSASIGISASADLGALGWLEGSSSIGLDGTLESYAIGHMTGTTEESSVLTPGTIASAVWGALSTENNTSGTMGAKLNSAASGGVDYGDMADAVRTELQAELTRIVELAQIHGLVIGTDLVVSATSRVAGDVSQSISEAAGIVTVTRS
jgi:hypothetical protein